MAPTGLSKTNIVNRAISLYEFIDAQMRKGYDLIIRISQARSACSASPQSPPQRDEPPS